MNVELSTISIKYRFPVTEKGFSLLNFKATFTNKQIPKLHQIPSLPSQTYLKIENFICI